MKSPCVKKCTLNSEGICTGCLRTKQEIQDWMYMSENQRRNVLLRIKLDSLSDTQKMNALLKMEG